VPVATVPLVPGASPDVVKGVRDDLSDVVQFIERTTGLRYYPVPTLLVDEHVVKTVRRHETVDAALFDPQTAVLTSALQRYLLAVNLHFHVGQFVPGGQDTLPREEYAARFGAGRLLTAEQFQWIRGHCESFPGTGDVPGVRTQTAIRRFGALIGQPHLQPTLSEFVTLVLDVCARAVVGEDPGRVVGAELYQVSRSDVPDDLLRVFTNAGGRVFDGRSMSLTGPAASFAALLNAIGDHLRPALLALQAHDPLRTESAPPEASAVLDAIPVASAVIREVLPWNHRLRAGFDVADMHQWIVDLIRPSWPHSARALVAEGLAAGPLRDARAVIDAFLARMTALLEEGLRAGGDFDVHLGFAVPEDEWTQIVAALGDHALAIHERREDRRDGTEVLLAGRFSDVLALYRRATERLLTILSAAGRTRSRTQRVFVEMSPTYGIFAPSRSGTTDVALFRWAGDQGLAQALTLPSSDRVLFCLGAADRFAAFLREGMADAAAADLMGAMFQRCVLVHEHFHAAAACALDADGTAPRGPGQTEWATALALNESLAVWMELHYVRGDAAMEELVWEYIRSGTYPEWPYAGAARLETEYGASGIDAIRRWVHRLRDTPDLAQKDFDMPAGGAVAV
jgi:hypothetical protein